MSIYPSRRNPGVLPIASHYNRREEVDFVGEWLAHVYAGRIGQPIPSTPEQLASLKAAEQVLLGHTPSFPPAPAPRPSRPTVPLASQREL